MKSLKDVLYKLIARDFLKWVAKNDYMDKGVSPLSKQYAVDALKSNTPDKESLKQAVIEENSDYHKVSVTLEEKIIDNTKTFRISRSEEYQGNVIESIDYIDEKTFEQESKEALSISKGEKAKYDKKLFFSNALKIFIIFLALCVQYYVFFSFIERSR